MGITKMKLKLANGKQETKKAFSYLGITFHPSVKLREGAAVNSFAEISKRIHDDLKLTPVGWSHKEFYEQARKNGCGDIDIFTIEKDGKDVTVLPCENTLFRYERNKG